VLTYKEEDIWVFTGTIALLFFFFSSMLLLMGISKNSFILPGLVLLALTAITCITGRYVLYRYRYNIQLREEVRGLKEKQAELEKVEREIEQSPHYQAQMRLIDKEV